MRKVTKIWLIIASILVVVGVSVFGGVMMDLNWDFNKLSTTQLVENTYGISAEFHDINVQVREADVLFYRTDDDEVAVVCRTFEDEPVVEVIGGVLVVQVNDARPWYEKIGIHFESPKVAIYLPDGEYGKLTHRSETGDCVVSGGSCFESIDISLRTGSAFCWASSKGAVNMSTTTGEIRLGGESAKTVKLETTTGAVSLWDVIAEEIIIAGTTGKVYMEACDAHKIKVSVTTGDVECSFLTPKAVSAHTTTGNVSVPDSNSGGSCSITTVTGDIEVAIKE